MANVDLQLFLLLSQCNRTIALTSFFSQIRTPPIKVGWVGSGCSVATEPTAEVSQFYNITQVYTWRKLCVLHWLFLTRCNTAYFLMTNTT